MTDHRVVEHSISTHYYSFNPLIFHGSIDSSQAYSLATQTAPIAKTAKVGNSSEFLTTTVYEDSEKATKIGLYTHAWLLSQDTNSTAWLCIEHSENRILADDPSGAKTDCYKINAKGDILDTSATTTWFINNGIMILNYSSSPL